MSTPRRLCLSTQNHAVILGRCDAANPAQHWAWLGGAKLLHTQSSMCLWADSSTHLPAHAKLTECSSAPAWNCRDPNGAFGLADTDVLLKKPGAWVTIGDNVQASDVDSGGSQLMISLCAQTGERRPSYKDLEFKAEKDYFQVFFSC